MEIDKEVKIHLKKDEVDKRRRRTEEDPGESQGKTKVRLATVMDKSARKSSGAPIRSCQ